MSKLSENAALVASVAHPISAPGDYDRIIEAIGDRQVVLIGEASHGTHEFYQTRARLTRRLIEEKNFRAIAVEADWPDALRVNRYLHGRGDDRDAENALRDFQRFPCWMWRNTVVREFVGWLRQWNATHPRAQVTST